MTGSLSFTAWLATYAIHSSLLLLAAFVASRIIQSEAAREIIWKAALVGPLLTTTVSSLGDYTPRLGHWTVERTTATSSLPVTSSSGVTTQSRLEAPTTIRVQPKSGATKTDAEVKPILMAGTFIPWLVITWALVSLLLIGRLLLHHRRLFQTLRARRAVNEGTLPGMLAELRRKSAVWTPVRLTASPACPSPIALGNSEICIPERFATDLDEEQQRNALAHELAHLKRRDPLWQLGAGMIESVFFFQPLNVVARKELRAAAEYLCDDWAVAQTRSPLALARCLAQISSWVGAASVPEGMMAMAEGGSPLIDRIERLAQWQATRRGPVRMSLMLATIVIAAVATAAPVFSANDVVSVAVNREASDENSRVELHVPDSIIKYAGRAASLDERWAWAESLALKGPVWFGWEVDGADSKGMEITSSSSRIPPAGAGSPTLAQLVGSASGSLATAILISPRAVNGANETLFQRLNTRIDLRGRPVIWLGRATASESFGTLQRLYRESPDVGVRKELAAVYAIHADAAAATRAIQSVVESEQHPDIREEGVQWLARLHGKSDEVVALLTRITLSDKDIGVQMEAVDGLRTALRKGNASAADALSRVAKSDAPMRVRSEAMQTLAAIK
jgi:beta-lactamase regulating signal transducer with metallopeptidase domain